MYVDNAEYFDDKTILVTGGTGSIGSEIVSHLLKYNPKTIRIFSNSENELWETQNRFKDSIKPLSNDALKLYNIYDNGINKMIKGLGGI